MTSYVDLETPFIAHVFNRYLPEMAIVVSVSVERRCHHIVVIARLRPRDLYLVTPNNPYT